MGNAEELFQDQKRIRQLSQEYKKDPDNQGSGAPGCGCFLIVGSIFGLIIWTWIVGEIFKFFFGYKG